jgi:hypothetical protein
MDIDSIDSEASSGVPGTTFVSRPSPMTPNRILLVFCLCIVAQLVSCKREVGSTKESRMTTPLVAEIVPRKSIGIVRLGMRTDALPPETLRLAASGTVDAIRFLVNEASEVDDIWIEDLRVFPHAVSYSGRDVPHDIPIEALSDIFAKCERVPGLKGGIFFNCANGLSLGTDFSHKTLKIGVKPISAHG